MTGPGRRSSLLWLALTVCAALYLADATSARPRSSRRGAGAPATTNVTATPLVDAQAGATYVGAALCAACHPNQTASFSQGIHGRIEPQESPSAIRGCESCHGPASLHVAGNREAIARFRPLWIPGKKDRVRATHEEEAAAEKGEASCLKCHKGGPLMEWAGSAHQMAKVTCQSCHQLHGTQGRKLLIKDGPELCYSCHQQTRMEFRLPSHHPVAEGKMDCTSCHAVHGSVNRALLNTDERPNELCFKCHASKQGPFTFEHAPVLEGCTTCHRPHGTVANKLLAQNEPFLCLQCHQMHFQSAHTDFGAAGDVSDPNAYGRTVTSQGPLGFQSAFMTRCTQCHPAVHGSDLPSQSRMGLGQGLTR